MVALIVGGVVAGLGNTLTVVTVGAVVSLTNVVETKVPQELPLFFALTHTV